jgi:hypothetical protein
VFCVVGRYFALIEIGRLIAYQVSHENPYPQ